MLTNVHGRQRISITIESADARISTGRVPQLNRSLRNRVYVEPIGSETTIKCPSLTDGRSATVRAVPPPVKYEQNRCLKIGASKEPVP